MRIEVNGARLFVDVEGPGLAVAGDGLDERPTLLLLHGSPGNSDHTVFKPMFSRLSDVAQVVYLDLLGCGRSDDAPDGRYSLERWADDVVGVCDALGLERPVVLGNSAGGMVAMAYGIRHPTHPGGLVLSSTQARLDPQRCLQVFERLGGAEARDVARRALIEDGDLAAWIRYGEVCSPLYNPTRPSSVDRITRRGAVAKAFHSLDGIWHRMDLLDGLGAIRCPTLVLAGAEDPVTPIEDSEDIVARLDPALVRFERFDGAGHGVWLDAEDAAFATLRRFVTEAGEPGESGGAQPGRRGAVAAIDLVVEFNERINAADLDGLVSLMAPAHRFVDSAGGSVEGRDASAAAWASFFEAFPGYRNVFDSVTEVTPGVVVAEGRSECSFEPLDGPARWQAIVDGGLVTEWRVEDPADGTEQGA